MDTPTTADRLRRIGTAVEHLVEPGEELLITRTEDGILVFDKRSGMLERDHPRLYGRLLSLNAQLESSILPTVIGFLLIGVFWLGLEAAWWQDWISGDTAEKLNVWWVFVLLVVLVFTVSGCLSELRARRVYRRARNELIPFLQEADLDRDLLLVRIKGDEELENVVRQLKLDRKPLP